MKPFLVGVAGPSGAGKSTVTRLIEISNPAILRISLDNYFLDVEDFPKVNDLPNWDLPDNLNFDLLLQNLGDLKEGRSTEVPIFNKASFERTREVVQPKQVILIDGFLLFFDKRIVDLLDKRIYIDVPDVIQLQRRSERETSSRISYVLGVVIPSYKIYGTPTKQYTDIVLNGDKTPEELKMDILQVIFTQV